MNTSGVWGKHEWVAAKVAVEHIVTAGEGYTHLLPVPRLAAQFGLGDVRVKQCASRTPARSKTSASTVLVSERRRRCIADRPRGARGGVRVDRRHVGRASPAYAAAADIPAVVILPRGKISTAQLVQPLANGALVLALDTDFDGCMRIVQRLAERDGVYLANSMNALRLEGQKTVAIEMCQQLGWQVPDWVVIPGGNLGNVSALGAGFEMMRALGLTTRMPRICVAQAAHAGPLAASYAAGWAPLVPVAAKTTLASAIQIGNPVSFPRALRALMQTNGVAVAVGEAELADAAALADRGGLFTCPHTGVALGALAQLAASRLIRYPTISSVVVSTASRPSSRTSRSVITRADWRRCPRRGTRIGRSSSPTATTRGAPRSPMRGCPVVVHVQRRHRREHQHERHLGPRTIEHVHVDVHVDVDVHVHVDDFFRNFLSPSRVTPLR